VPALADGGLGWLPPPPGKGFGDGTLGGAGHTGLLLAAGARVYGIDQDPYALDRARAANPQGLTVLEGNYRDQFGVSGRYSPEPEAQPSTWNGQLSDHSDSAPALGMIATGPESTSAGTDHSTKRSIRAIVVARISTVVRA